ncbi:MAG: MOSC domain-containing protein [Rhodoferax sp.]|uniref:MOSC domain-containing protein n=1 Tax=Rhodoferax sp. TaxID=50421 RepID=UPI0026052211|nr:MOSC domain-containing protein [Rhodoferax sp.]MDD5332584.1 MOSC domain-containing protein [Rhodoferax sp.]
MFTLLGVQTAPARRIQIEGRSILTAIHKLPVTGPVQVSAMGLSGDEQADLTVHGGLDKAVYAYPVEHYPFWRAQRTKASLMGSDDAALPLGTFGENLTLQGLLETEVWVGDVLRFAACALRVTQPRQPCYKFNAVMGFSGASKVMAQSGYCGFYLALEQAGHLSAGEPFELLPGPRRLSIAESFQAKMFKHLR